jgi:hypothetical protein
MDADYSIELGREDPVLDFPWTDPAGNLAYVDLKRHPELIDSLDEVKRFPELGDFLRVLNSPESIVETAKCDAWATTELSPEEEIYDASHKFVSYVDVVFDDVEQRSSLAAHEQFARELVESLQRGPEDLSAAEVCIRRCYFVEVDSMREGLYCTLYVSGYGDDGESARWNWGMGLTSVGGAIVRLSP